MTQTMKQWNNMHAFWLMDSSLCIACGGWAGSLLIHTAGFFSFFFFFFFWLLSCFHPLIVHSMSANDTACPKHAKKYLVCVQLMKIYAFIYSILEASGCSHWLSSPIKADISSSDIPLSLSLALSPVAPLVSFFRLMCLLLSAYSVDVS